MTDDRDDELQRIVDAIFESADPTPVHVQFPARLADRDGSLVTPGTRVTVIDGPHRGEYGVVRGWAGEGRVSLTVESASAPRAATPPSAQDRRSGTSEVTDVPSGSVRLATLGDEPADDEPTVSDSVGSLEPPAPHADTGGLAGLRLPAVVEARDLRCDLDPQSGVRIGVDTVSPESVPTVLIVPVGGRDIQERSGPSGPFPPSSSYTSTRSGNQTKVDARAWGAACLDAIAGRPDAERAELVARHLDAPMLRRVLSEAVLPEELERLTFVVTDQQGGELPDGHVDDSVHFGELLHLWLLGTAQQRYRRVRTVGRPIVLSRNPQVTHAVVATVRRQLDDVVDGCDEAVIVHAGGTPAMFMGLQVAAVSRPELRVRITQPVENGPIYDVAAS